MKAEDLIIGEIVVGDFANTDVNYITFHTLNDNGVTPVIYNNKLQLDGCCGSPRFKFKRRATFEEKQQLLESIKQNRFVPISELNINKEFIYDIF